MRLWLALAIAVIPQLACAQALELACAGPMSAAGAGGPERMRLRMDPDGSARLQLPADLLPKHHTGDPDTWRKVDDFLLTDTQISGRYRFDVIRTGRFTIDRRTGAVVLTAKAGDFTGVCESTVTGPGSVRF